MNNYNYNGYSGYGLGQGQPQAPTTQGYINSYNYLYQAPTMTNLRPVAVPSKVSPNAKANAAANAKAMASALAKAKAATAADFARSTHPRLMPPTMTTRSMAGPASSASGSPLTSASPANANANANATSASAAMSMDRKIGTEDPEYRLRSKTVAILDIGSAIVTMGFHMFTIISQEAVEDGKHSRNNVLVPLTPVQLQLHGYLLVLAWIGIIAVNIVQLLIGCTLLTSTSSEIEATKALSGSRTWIKTCIFILILLVFKLVILYFMSEMGTRVTFTTLICILEFFIRSTALVTVMKYLHAVTMAFPDISQIYYDAEQLVESPKRNPVTDAVWF